MLNIIQGRGGACPTRICKSTNIRGRGKPRPYHEMKNNFLREGLTHQLGPRLVLGLGIKNSPA